MSETVTILPTAGTHIREALAEALATAVQAGAAVRFDFNGTTHEVLPTDSYDLARGRAEAATGFPILTREEDMERARLTMERMEAEAAASLAAAGAATEAEMRTATVPTPRSEDELLAYIRSLVDRPHDYGTAVFAMSMAATAAFNYAAAKVGATGFQASCADMDILHRTRGWKWGRLLDYENLLYPQYLDAEHFPGWRELIDENRNELAKRARELLTAERAVNPDVRRHWEWLTSLTAPPASES